MTCYFKYSNTDGPVSHDQAFPCVANVGSSVVQCCNGGDLCMGEGLCQYAGSGPSKNFYVGGCTSSSFDGSACLNTCTSQNTSDIIYNGTAQVWQCCTSAGNCANPAQDDILSAPAVNQLQTIATIASNGVVTPLSTTAVQTTSTSASGAAGTAPARPESADASQSPNSASSGGLSTGATAGIAVGAVLFALLLAAIAVFLWRRRSKRALNAEQRGNVFQPAANHPPPSNTYYEPPKQYPISPSEKDATARAPPELPPMTGRLRSELPTTGPSHYHHHAELPGSDVQRSTRQPPPFQVGTEA